jgi:hypothetical protein
MLRQTLAAGAVFFLLASPAYAATTVISSLGNAPLIGELRSTQELTQQVFANGPRLSKAAAELGLTTAQYDEFRSDVATDENIRWVTVPRHLDAMSWQSGGRVHVIRDVMIPAKTHGWAVYLDDGPVVYMPAKCGNLSVLKRPARRVAFAPKSQTVAAPLPAPAPPVVAAPPPPPADVAAAPPEAPSMFPTPTPLSAIPAPPPVHHNFLAAIGGLLLPLFILPGGGGGGGSAGSGSPPSPGGFVGAPAGGGCVCP